MKLAAGLILVIAALGVATMWDRDALKASVPDALWVGAAVGIGLLAGIVGLWLRKRQRRRMLRTRDSALW